MEANKKMLDLCEYYRNLVENMNSTELQEMEILDTYYTVDAGMCYVGAKLYLSMGGPTVYIDTNDGYVHLSWGYESVKCGLTLKRLKEIDNIHAERFLEQSFQEV